MRSWPSDHNGTLLCADDPLPAVVVNGQSQSPVVLICEHAGRVIPSTLGDMGLTPSQMDLHIAYDIGAEPVARHMAYILDAPLVLQPYSRLVFDCNRPAGSPTAIPEISDSVVIPANNDIDPVDAQQRVDEIFIPFHDTVSSILDSGPRRAVFAIHSFTPVLGGEHRPWELAFLFRKDMATSRFLADAVKAMRPEIRIGMNEPYTIEDNADWFVPYHGEQRGLAHSLIEIRNDLLDADEAYRDWANLLCSATESYLNEASR
ncbi:MAG: N-formylglutamate amidohydrolase [Hyphomicrobiales bacterium]|nr:N-formylglutamate amidohydrolase [Hyphomicrobiales bacterium]MCP4997912.1 N-formylglutamate amidohydrolase [Hyphomicrobiales bacterium]